MRVTAASLPAAGSREQGSGGDPEGVGAGSPRHSDGLEYSRSGLASWYGGAFHGRTTANGEIFDVNSFTAAHPNLPLPSHVRVTNLENGRAMVVRVNDRGPFQRSRLIDLSSRAAEALGFRDQGLAQVKVDYLGPAPPGGGEDRLLLGTLTAGRGSASALADPVATNLTVSAQAMVPASFKPSGPPLRLVAWTLQGRRNPSPGAASPGRLRLGSNPPDAARASIAGQADSSLYMIAGTFRDPGDAERLRAQLSLVGTVHIVPVVTGSGALYRVEVGPLHRSRALDAIREAELARVRGASLVTR